MKKKNKEAKRTIKYLLQKNEMFSNKIIQIDKHLNILSMNPDYVIARFSRLGLINPEEELTDLDKAMLLDNLISMCDCDNKNYNYHIEDEFIRIGFKTDQFETGHCHNKWGSLMSDDYFGFGNEPTSLYDDYVDETNDLKHNRKK
ncbi:MAG: hypothetical protein IJF92_02990 [Bacilli bacterium]|nr:hypothetical protein [Bacilli bacterium]